MNVDGKGQSSLVVSPSSWSVNTVLLVIVFVVTSALVYHWGHKAASSVHAEPRYDMEAFRREQRRQTEAAHASAVAAAEEARIQWQRAEAERRDFVDRFLQDQETEALHAAQSQTLPSPHKQPAPAARVENPEWVELSGERDRLERRLAELLVDRTPAHPEVQGLTQELTEVRQVLSGVARWIGPEAGRGPLKLPLAEWEAPHAETNVAKPVDLERFAREHAEAREQLDRLSRKVEAARIRHEQAAAAERAAWADHVRGPEIDMTISPPAEVISADAGPGRLLSISLFAGLAMMVGVGMVATGAAMEPALDSATQVSTVTGVPVIAAVTIPGLKPLSGLGRHRAWLRLASCLGGAALIAGCVGLWYWAVTG